MITTAAEFVRGMAAREGLRLGIEGKIGRCLVFVEPRAASTETVMRGVALAVHASVERTPSGLIIQRTPADVRDMRNERTAYRATWLLRKLEDAQAFRSRKLKQADVHTAISQEVERDISMWEAAREGKRFGMDPMGVNMLLPSEELLEDLVRRIGVSELASISSDQTHVFSNSGSAADRKLPPCQDLVDRYETGVAALRGRDLPADLQRIPGRIKDFFADWHSGGGVPSVLRLQVSATENQINLKLEGFGRDGSRKLFAYLMAWPNKELRVPGAVLREVSSREDQEMAPVSEETAIAARFLRSPRGEKPPGWFTSPERVEPLNLAPLDALRSMAASDESNCFVAYVSDSLWDNANACVEGRHLNISAFREIIKQWNPYERLAVDGTTVWRPRDLEVDELRRASRKALGRFARASLRLGYPSLQLKAELFNAACDAVGPLATSWSDTATENSAAVGSPGTIAPRMYRFLGAIPQPGWDRLEAGAEVRIGDLGLEPDLMYYLANDPYVQTTSDGPSSDLYRYPLEAVPVQSLDNVQISLRANNIGVMRAWPSSQAENAFWTVKDFTRPSVLALPAGNGRPARIATTREQWEASVKHLRFRAAVRTDTHVQLRLPGTDLFLRADGPGIISSVERPFVYSDLPVFVRDKNWDDACREALQSAGRGWSRIEPSGARKPIRPE